MIARVLAVAGIVACLALSAGPALLVLSSVPGRTAADVCMSPEPRARCLVRVEGIGSTAALGLIATTAAVLLMWCLVRED